FGNVIPFTMLAWGEERITSALTAVLNASTPLFTAVFAFLYLKDRLRLVHAAGLLVGFGGVAVAAGFGGGDLAHSSLAGSAAAVLAGASYGIAFVYMRKHLTGIEPTVAAAGQLIMATVLSLPLAVGTSLSTGLHLDPHRVLAISLLGVIVLGEAFQWRLVAGGVLIAAGISLVNPPVWLRRPPRSVQPLLGGTALVVVVALVVAPLVACSGDGNRACSKVTTEPLNPDVRHVFAGGPEPRYTTDPPTSGPHTPGALPGGVLDTPLSRPNQVGALEAGLVLLQYRDLNPGELDELRGLASNQVVVAPNPTLPDRVVATAWLTKQTCSAVDVTALRGFI